MQLEIRPLQAGLVTAIAKLHKLARLKLGPGEGAIDESNKLSQGARSPGLHALAACTALTQLILSHVIVREEEVRRASPEKRPSSLHPHLRSRQNLRRVSY